MASIPLPLFFYHACTFYSIDRPRCHNWNFLGGPPRSLQVAPRSPQEPPGAPRVPRADKAHPSGKKQRAENDQREHGELRQWARWWLIDWFTDTLIDWLTNSLNDWFIDWLVRCQHALPVDSWLTGALSGLLVFSFLCWCFRFVWWGTGIFDDGRDDKKYLVVKRLLT